MADQRDNLEDDEPLEEYDFRNEKDAVLFCIDASEQMINPSDQSGLIPAKVALEAAFATLQQRIISQPNDAIGILLYGTEKQTENYDSCFLLLSLDIPDAQSMRNIRDILEDDRKFNELFQPAKKSVPFPTVLFYINRIFGSIVSQYIFRRVFLVTNNDDPCGSDPGLKLSSRTRMEDLQNLGIKIEPFFLSRNGEKFDASRFYEDFLLIGQEEDVDSIDLQSSSSIDLLEIKSRVKARQVPRHAVFTVALEIVPGKLSIQVKGYVLFKRQEIAKSHYVYEDKDGNKHLAYSSAKQVETEREGAKDVHRKGSPLSTPKKRKSQASADSLQEKSQIKRGYKVSGEILKFTDEEFKSLRLFEDPVIRIIGFKPVSQLSLKDNLRSSHFLYPAEEDYVGSVRTFAALHEALISEEKFALAWAITTTRSSPAICALVAAPEVFSDETRHTQVSPPGIYMIRQPFTDDLRSVPRINPVRAPLSSVDKAREMIRSITMSKGYDPDRYPNPVLQWHYRILQAIALEEELPSEAQEDFTKPKYNSIHNRAGPKIKEMKLELE
ncbi:SPOC like C-terminal domain-containing protein [Dipodascopsis uninucleata]